MQKSGGRKIRKSETSVCKGPAAGVVGLKEGQQQASAARAHGIEEVRGAAGSRSSGPIVCGKDSGFYCSRVRKPLEGVRRGAALCEFVFF